MTVVENASRAHFTLPGIDHQTLASHLDGLRGLEVWLQSLDPRAETPAHYHDCEEVIVVLRGSGRATLGSETITFGPNTTHIVPPGLVHKLTNGSAEPMLLLAALSASPARIFAPDGTEMPIPWVVPLVRK